MLYQTDFLQLHQARGSRVRQLEVMETAPRLPEWLGALWPKDFVLRRRPGSSWKSQPEASISSLYRYLTVSRFLRLF